MPFIEKAEYGDERGDSPTTRGEVTLAVKQVLDASAPGMYEICPEFPKILGVVGMSWCHAYATSCGDLCQCLCISRLG